MAPVLTRVKKEQLRKRCTNLLRRHNEFWLLYGMKSWLVMERPDGQIFKYYSHPGTSPPSEDDMKGNRAKPPIVRTPRYYETTNTIESSQPKEIPPSVNDSPRECDNIWEILALYLKENRCTNGSI
ncbi:hypothetical protein N7450_011759 [Penicillium hetheringtonii]|uniref:Uncharacterized protein n=1 Tax=Penicillium hetheringtonii TaxID=911720 RepID=A0AAD6DAW5_9EURO|nr:hypothetical protein N7450_011759 [Penicillium hetheringtonii]